MKDISMTRNQEEEFLYQGRILRLATVARNNRGSRSSRLHVVPIWYLYENNKIYVHTGADSVKVRDIRTNNSVAMCVDVGEFYYDLKNIRMRGRARLLKDQVLSRNIAEKILVKYLGSSSHPQAKKYLASNSNHLVIEIEVLEKYSEDYSQLGMGS